MLAALGQVSENSWNGTSRLAGVGESEGGNKP